MGTFMKLINKWLKGLWKIHNFEEDHDFSKPSEGIELNKQFSTLGNHKYVMAWAVQSSLYQSRSFRKEDSGTGYE